MAVLVLTAPDAMVALTPRYHYAPATMMTWVFVIAARRPMEGVLPVLVVALGNPGTLALPARTDRVWAQGAACLASGRSDCRIPIHPEGWSIVLNEPIGKRQMRCGDRD